MTAEDVAARPGWSEITAVKEGRIEALDEDLASRWGPRLPEFFRSIAAVLPTPASRRSGQLGPTPDIPRRSEGQAP